MSCKFVYYACCLSDPIKLKLKSQKEKPTKPNRDLRLCVPLIQICSGGVLIIISFTATFTASEPIFIKSGVQTFITLKSRSRPVLLSQGVKRQRFLPVVCQQWLHETTSVTGLSPIKKAFPRIFHPSLQTVRTSSTASSRLFSHNDGGGGYVDQSNEVSAAEM